MKITQLSIFLENKGGRLCEVISLLGDNNINIRALTIAESENYGILRVVADKPDEALAAVKKAGFAANITDIVAVEIEDLPGGLAKLLKVLKENKINVEYMYSFVERSSDKALMVFRFENIDEATAVIKQSGFNIIGRKGIPGL